MRWGAGQGVDEGPEFKVSGRGCHVLFRASPTYSRVWVWVWVWVYVAGFGYPWAHNPDCCRALTIG